MSIDLPDDRQYVLTLIKGCNIAHGYDRARGMPSGVNTLTNESPDEKPKSKAGSSVQSDSPVPTSDHVNRNWHNLDNRLSLIAESAYFKAQKREFEPGHEVADWLEAEQELAEIMGVV